MDIFTVFSSVISMWSTDRFASETMQILIISDHGEKDVHRKYKSWSLNLDLLTWVQCLGFSQIVLWVVSSRHLWTDEETKQFLRPRPWKKRYRRHFRRQTSKKCYSFSFSVPDVLSPFCLLVCLHLASVYLHIHTWHGHVADAASSPDEMTLYIYGKFT